MSDRGSEQDNLPKPGGDGKMPEESISPEEESVDPENVREDQRSPVFPIPPLYLSDRKEYLQIISIFPLLFLAALVIIGIFTGVFCLKFGEMLYWVSLFPVGLCVLFCLACDPQATDSIVIIPQILGYAVYLYLIGLAVYCRTRRDLLIVLWIYLFILLLNSGGWVLIGGGFGGIH
jgi:hypothetical protein